MTTIKDIINFTETFAPLSSAMEFDNVGLLIGNEDTNIKAAVVALDITDSVIDEAVKNEAQLIISHHPIIFDPVKSISEDSIVYRLISNKFSALCLHTNLDLSPVFGVNTCLAEAVGVKNAEFVEGKCLYIGELESEMTGEQFADKVKNALKCEGIRYTLGDKKVKKIAICSGSGGDLAPLAKENGADLLLTGEIKHHDILEANRLGIAIIDAGHFKTEDIVITPFTEKLSNAFPEVNFTRSESCTDGIRFI